MRKVLALASIFTALTLTGCASYAEDTGSTKVPEAPQTDQSAELVDWEEIDFKLRDGRTVTCIGSYRTVSCDWAGAE